MLPSPAKPLACQNPDCTLPEGGRCARAAEFANPLADCPDLLRGETTVAPALAESDPAPWSGRHLTVEEADALVRQTLPRVVAILGPFNAGKTCLLTSFFLQLACGQRAPFRYRFASSRTLHGFRELAERASQWTGEDMDIVAHTPVEEGEPMGHFLHLGLRPENTADDRYVDMVISDIPGEWIREWGERVDESSRRRLGFVERSDAFLVLVDARKLLAGDASLDASTARLIRRVIEAARAEPQRRCLALVFSKFDLIAERVVVPPLSKRLERNAWGELGKRSPRTWGAIEEARRFGLRSLVFAVSAFPTPMAHGQPYGVMEPFAFVLEHSDRREIWGRRVPAVPKGASSFVAMRRWEALL